MKQPSAQKVLTDANDPLVPPLEEGALPDTSAAPLSQWSAFLLLLKINWGIGMMAMPYYILKAGLWLGMYLYHHPAID